MTPDQDRDIYLNEDSNDYHYADVRGDLNISLLEAVRQGDVNAAEEIKFREPAFFAKTLRTNGGDFLICAVVRGHINIIDFLLRNRCRRVRYPSFTNALHVAAQLSNNSFLVRILDDCPLMIDECDWNKLTPLHHACTFDMEENVKILLAKGANYEATTAYFDMPLHVAAAKGHVRCVQALLEFGAPCNVSQPMNVYSRTPLDSAVRSLFAMFGYDYISHNIQQFIEWNAYLTKSRWTELVLENTKADGTSNKLAGKPLDVMCQTIDLLIQSGAKWDIMALTSRHFPPDLVIPTVEVLIEEYGRGVNTHDCLRFTPLHYAVSWLSFDAVKYFIEKGANVNSLSVNEVSPLELALREPANEQVARLLIENGADVDYVTSRGWSPLFEVVQIDHYPLVQLLLETGANPNRKDVDGWSALLHALRQSPMDAPSSPEVVNCLMKYGADIDVTTTEGTTPLHMAAQIYYDQGTDGAVATMKILLEHVDNVDVRDSEGFTSLMRAASVRPPRYIYANSMRLLLDAGADPHLCNNEGRNAMFLAMASRNLEAASLMLEHEKRFDFSDTFSDPDMLLAATRMDFTYNVAELLFIKHFHYRDDVIEARKKFVDEILLDLPEKIASLDDVAYWLQEWLKNSSVERSCLRQYVGGPTLLFQEVENFILRNHLFGRGDITLELQEYLMSGLEVGPSYEDACIKECASMKTEEVYTGLTLYDILTINFDELCKLVSKPHIYLALSAKGKQTFVDDAHYPIYAHTLRQQVRAALSAHDLAQAATCILTDIFPPVHTATTGHHLFSTLPNHVTDHIISHLSTTDLHNLLVSQIDPPFIDNVKQRWQEKLTQLLSCSKAV